MLHLGSRIPHLSQVAPFAKTLRDCFLQNVSVVATSFDDDQGSRQGLARHRDPSCFLCSHTLNSLALPYRLPLKQI